MFLARVSSAHKLFPLQGLMTADSFSYSQTLWVPPEGVESLACASTLRQAKQINRCFSTHPQQNTCDTDKRESDVDKPIQKDIIRKWNGLHMFHWVRAAEASRLEALGFRTFYVCRFRCFVYCFGKPLCYFHTIRKPHLPTKC